ncbi:MAG: hypothetical protein QXO37_06875 [Candidatus Nitrosocaldaceae archaeon]
MSFSTKFKINKEKAKEYHNQFLNPAEDFVGILEFVSEIRKINTKNGEVEVVDAKVKGYDTREVKIKDGNNIIIKQEKVEYDDIYSLVLSKIVIADKLKKFEPLIGKKIVIVGLGKREGKNYLDYYVATEQEAIASGVLTL